MIKPDVKPENNNFSSGPCSKRPGWNSGVLNKAILGRSHRSSQAKSRINYLIKNVVETLSIPNDYYVGIVPGSATGAVEIALWNLIGIQETTPARIHFAWWHTFVLNAHYSRNF